MESVFSYHPTNYYALRLRKCCGNTFDFRATIWPR
jgi:hypothetical protein